MLSVVTGISFCVKTSGKGKNLFSFNAETSKPEIILVGTDLSCAMVRNKILVLRPLMLS